MPEIETRTAEARASAEELIQTEDRWGAHNYRPLDVVVERASGVWVYAVDGNRYLDCLAAYSALNQGHCHPKIRAALVEQAGRVSLTSRAFRNVELPLLDHHDLLGFEMALPMNTGVEAVDTAHKSSRKWRYGVRGIPEGRAEIV